MLRASALPATAAVSSSGQPNATTISIHHPKAAFRATLSGSQSHMENVTVVQVGDDASFEKYRMAIRTVRSFAQIHGFDYQRILLDKGEFDRPWCVLTLRLEAMASFLDSKIADEGWMLYLDLDIAIMKNATLGSNFRAIMPRTSLDGAATWFVAQDSLYSVNAGFTLWRKTNESMAMMRIWEWRQKHFETCIGPGDQFSLELAIAEVLNKNVTRETHACSTFYRDPKRLRIRDFDEINACWSRHLGDVGLPFNGRSRAGICLLPSWHRINMHDTWQGPPYSRGDYLFHGHTANQMAVEGIDVELLEVPITKLSVWRHPTSQNISGWKHPSSRDPYLPVPVHRGPRSESDGGRALRR